MIYFDAIFRFRDKVSNNVLYFNLTHDFKYYYMFGHFNVAVKLEERKLI